MFSRSFPVTRIHGIEVRLSASLPLFALLVLWAFGARFATSYTLTVAVLMGIVASTLMFVSILAHELGHALEARHRDLEVIGITLSMLGGATEMHARDQSARDELAIAAIGPYVSLLCAAVFGLIATYAPELLPRAVAVPVGDVAGLLGWLNVALALLNLIPGAPLDGGRVLRAALWWLLGDRHRGLVIAGRCGQLLWVAVVGVAVWAFQRSPDLRITAVLVGMVGVVLFDAARREIRAAGLERLYSGRRVADLVGDGAPAPVPAEQALELVPPVTEGGAPGTRLVVVHGPDGTAAGLLDLTEVEQMHPTERSVRTAGDLARSIEGLPTVDASDDLHTLIERFQGEPTVVLVRRDDRAIAAITERETAQALAALRDGRLPPPTAAALDGDHHGARS